uniref:Uncharacterized protein n=1 Tax=Cucumis melo TaxID=3656 RepID=A0A9I9DIT7_CUCME
HTNLQNKIPTTIPIGSTSPRQGQLREFTHQESKYKSSCPSQSSHISCYYPKSFLQILRDGRLQAIGFLTGASICLGCLSLVSSRCSYLDHRICAELLVSLLRVLRGDRQFGGGACQAAGQGSPMVHSSNPLLIFFLPLLLFQILFPLFGHFK